MPYCLHTDDRPHFLWMSRSSNFVAVSKHLCKTLALTPVAFMYSIGDFSIHPELMGSLLKYCLVFFPAAVGHIPVPTY